MYDCVPENGGGFFEGACAPSNATTYLRDPPPPRNTRIEIARSALESFGEH
jgi:hypothetical protein